MEPLHAARQFEPDRRREPMTAIQGAVLTLFTAAVLWAYDTLNTLRSDSATHTAQLAAREREADRTLEQVRRLADRNEARYSKLEADVRQCLEPFKK